MSYKNSHEFTRTTPYEELPEFFTVMELTALLGIGRTTAYKLVNSDSFPIFRVGGQIRIPKSGLKNSKFLTF